MKSTAMQKLMVLSLLVPALLAQEALTLDQKEQFLLKASITRQRASKKGITGTVRATLSDGSIAHDASIQSINEQKAKFEGVMGCEINFRDTYLFNIAACRLGKKLGLGGMILPSVSRSHTGASSAWTWWVPLVMAASQSQLALDALTFALKDPVFQIRFRSAYAMRQILRDRPALELHADRVWRLLSAELQVDRVEWEERRMSKNSSANQERPGDASVEYLFLLLKLLLPPEPVEMAYRALGTEDRHLRGTALEYLQTALPSATWKQIEGLTADHLVKAKT